MPPDKKTKAYDSYVGIIQIRFTGRIGSIPLSLSAPLFLSCATAQKSIVRISQDSRSVKNLSYKSYSKHTGNKYLDSDSNENQTARNRSLLPYLLSEFPSEEESDHTDQESNYSNDHRSKDSGSRT